MLLNAKKIFKIVVRFKITFSQISIHIYLRFNKNVQIAPVNDSRIQEISCRQNIPADNLYYEMHIVSISNADIASGNFPFAVIINIQCYLVKD